MGNESTGVEDDAPVTAVRPFSEFRSTGLLWLLNRCALHPRGFAIAFHFADDDDDATGEPLGWSLIWDGTEPGSFTAEADDEMFAALEALLDGNRPTFTVEREGVKVAFKTEADMAAAMGPAEPPE